jgi:hypothetical protein
MTDSLLLGGFFWLAFALLVSVTLGVSYLTYLEWRDRRRRRP